LNFIENLNRLIGFYITILKATLRLNIWWPFFLYALVQAAVLFGCLNYVHPMVNPILSPLVTLLGEAEAEMFAHYPGLYLLLPMVFQWGKLAVGFLFEGLTIGLTVILFLRYYNPESAAEWKLSEVIRRWPQLLLGWLVISTILFMINWFIPGYFVDYIHGSPRRRLLLDFGLKAVTVGVYSLFIYTLPAIIIYRQNFVKALRFSLGFFVRYPIFSFFLALIPYLLSLPISYISTRTELVVLKFRPELVFYVLLVGIAIDLIINFTLAGTVTRFILDEKK
jgi:hypothetical protein